MNNEAIKKIADTYGYDTQSRQLIEEMAELMVAINKMWREGMRTDYFYSELKKKDIAEELADVTIMLEQIKYLLQISDADIDQIIDQKLNRKLERIEKNE